jgi:hypothetical protein
MVKMTKKKKNVSPSQRHNGELFVSDCVTKSSYKEERERLQNARSRYRPCQTNQKGAERPKYHESLQCCASSNSRWEYRNIHTEIRGRSLVCRIICCSITYAVNVDVVSVDYQHAAKQGRP